jgi:hypothetical protein
MDKTFIFIHQIFCLQEGRAKAGDGLGDYGGGGGGGAGEEQDEAKSKKKSSIRQCQR